MPAGYNLPKNLDAILIPVGGDLGKILGKIFFLALAGCSNSIQPSDNLNNSATCYADYSEVIYSGAGKVKSLTNLLSSAKRSKYVLIGEIHTNPTHHKKQFAIVQRLAQQGTHGSLLFEMLDPSFNPVLARYQKNEIPSETLQNVLEWDDRGWPIWPSYFPLFEEAKAHSMEIKGANISNDLLPFVTLYGGLAFPRKQRNEMGLGKDDPFLGDQDIMEVLIRKSHSVDETIIPTLVTVQYAKDAHMAHELMKTKSRTILIAGNYHVQRNIGVPLHLAKHDPYASTLSIGMMELTKNVPTPTDFFENTSPDLRDYDFIWFTDTRCPTSDSDSE